MNDIYAGIYRDRRKGVQILLSNSQAGSGSKVKQEQEEISRNHIQAFLPIFLLDTVMTHFGPIQDPDP